MLKSIIRLKYIRMAVAAVMAAFMMTACSNKNEIETDIMNELSYDFHYRNLDSTLYYAQKAEQLAKSYDGGRAEAFNNKAFVSIARMQYALAEQQLDSILHITDNQVELLIADIQQMRLCQRQSKNKDFYTYRESAMQRFKRIDEDQDRLNEHHQKRMIYARSEFDIVTSTYYYYVGLEEPAVEAMEQIDPNGEILQDVQQHLNYLYNVGAGGTITQGTQEEINQMEMEYLFKCYSIAMQYNYTFWTANSLQAISEHMQVPHLRERLIADNFNEFKSINADNVPDSLIAVNLARRSLQLFTEYGDVYQMAGSYRTLAQCSRLMGDNEMSLKYLNDALNNDSAIYLAPDLVASIWEQLSVIYAAKNDKTHSHLYRNKYLDTQDQTRQDRYYESRAEQLSNSVRQLSVMTSAIVALLVIGLVLLFLFYYLRKRKSQQNDLQTLLLPLEKWKKDNEKYMAMLDERHEEANEQKAMAMLHIENNKRLNLEQRAKVSLVNMVTPYIDRMLHEIYKLRNADESQQLRDERYAYVAELTDRIMDYNNVLTQWIQLRKGELSLHIESFSVKQLFDIVAHSRRGFQLRGINLVVNDTDAWVKADKILTLFMINTMADNARKFTPDGGTVTVDAKETDNFVEISVADTGVGMTEEQMAEVFSVEKKAFNDDASEENTSNPRTPNKEKGHGFGLVNCKGIIEKYKKISSLFKVCSIGVDSKLGEGSKFFFRLPKGIARNLSILFIALCGALDTFAQDDILMMKAADFADSVWTCNTQDRFNEAVAYADSALKYINLKYKGIAPNSTDTLIMESNKSVLQAEILWYHDMVNVDFNIILQLRNEIAVAALALHKWSLYNYNNKVYTQLYKEMSADNTLPEYCSVMQKSQSNRYMAIVILIILLLLILMAYFTLYYRHLVYFRFCLERVRAMNNVLNADMGNESKLKEIEKLAGKQDDDNKKIRSLVYDNEKLPQQLQEVADQLISTLQKSISANKKRLADIDLAEDEVRKCQFENDKLHVSNSVLDNCLSTLKHETMYYPSRIRTLLDSGDAQLQSISELADYYKELYTLLSAQAMRQVEYVKPECVPVKISQLIPKCKSDVADIAVLGDSQMLRYLFDILKKQGKGVAPDISISERDDRYVDFSLTYKNLNLDDEQCHELFNPDMANLPFMLCRQIVRDVGEATNARGCGITARYDGKGGNIVVVTLVKAKRNKNNI